MNKGLIVKIALGLIIVAIPVSMILNSKKQSETIDETSKITQEDSELLDDLYSNTLEESKDETSIDKGLNEESTEVGDIEEITTDTTTENLDKEETKTEVSENAKTVTGQYQGFADENFMEVKLGDEYRVFKVPNNMKSKVESKNIGDSITFTYVASAGQQIITAIN